MKRFSKRDPDGLGSDLRARRPEPRPDFLHALAERIGSDARSARMYALSRVAFAAAVTVLMVGTLFSLGGLSYAASGTRQAVKAAKRIVAPSRPKVVRHSAAQDQYKPEKVTICHKGHTITISRSALPAHLAHGDTVGPCPAGGVAGAGAGAGVAGAQKNLFNAGTASTLPFTGISLAATFGLSLLLIGTGVALRRLGRRSPGA